MNKIIVDQIIGAVIVTGNGNHVPVSDLLQKCIL